VVLDHDLAAPLLEAGFVQLCWEQAAWLFGCGSSLDQYCGVVENERAVVAWAELNPPLCLTSPRAVRLAPIQVRRPYDLDAASAGASRDAIFRPVPHEWTGADLPAVVRETSRKASGSADKRTVGSVPGQWPR
jgi:hypothetical protein